MNARAATLLMVMLLLPGCPGSLDPSLDLSSGPDAHHVTLIDSRLPDTNAGGMDGSGPKKDSKAPSPDSKVIPSPDTYVPKPDTTPWGHDIGKKCTSNGECAHGICATNTHTGVKFCTKQCNKCSPSPCPSGTGCQNAGPFYICAPGYPNAPC